MKVLVDQNDKVYARGEKDVAEGLTNLDRWAEGLDIRTENYPEDTVFERVNGRFVVSDEQRRDPEWQAQREKQTRLMKRREAVKKDQRLETLPERIERIEALLEIDNAEIPL